MWPTCLRKLAFKVWTHNTYAKNETYTLQEMAELTKEITKNQLDLGDINHITEELAHVMLMTKALQFNYGIQDENINREMKKAVQKMYAADKK